MIGYIDIKKAITDKLREELSDIKILAMEELSGFDKPAFFVQLIPVNENIYIDYEEKFLTVNIHYFSEEKTDLANLKMLDKLNSVFLNTLKLQDRNITITSKKPAITDNVLQFKFDIEVVNNFEQIEINNEYIPYTAIDEAVGYNKGNVELGKELKIEEE